ncbi:glycosyl hydrolase [Lacibacter sp. MH-610]|uniref:glycosyl hydrolase n=1 Tax=Lacibacter sp. MH-610 TaxID=3020883 RepID=UPI003891B57D
MTHNTILLLQQTIRNLFFAVILVLPVYLSAQIVPAGSGSYTLQLPPPDAAGRNVLPNGTPRVSGAAASKPIMTNDWWTGLLTFNDANLYNYPLSMKGSSSGLVMSFTFLGLGANDTRQPMGPEQPIILGVSGLTATYPTVSDYTDWTVTASWSNAGRSFNAIMGMGMPFVYCTKGNADVASVVVNTGTVSVQGEMLLITNSISGANFAVYAPVGSVWSNSGNTYTSTLAGKNYFSAAMLPAGVSAATAANDFKQYAYVFPANTSVSWNYNNATSTMQSTFTATPDVKEGSGSTVLLGLLPHQWAHLGAGSPLPGSYAYTTSRGVMKMLASNSFIVENKFKGVLSALPLMAKYSSGFDPAALNSKIDLVKNSGLDLWTDSYNEGLAMNKLVQVAKIADQMGNTEARDKLINTVKTRLENWLKAVQGENAFIFYYNNTWTTLIGYPAGYSADANINDHHFHYANFINAASAVEQFQPGWAANWGPMVNMLVRDAANWEKSNTMFPFLRNFNPYAGHSFASGQLNAEPHGNNQESSSEAMNFASSLIHWGILSGNNAIRDLGIYLYTTEQTAIEEYWFDMSDRNFAPTYSQMMCARVWGNGYDRNTFWTGDIAAMYGIQMFPLTGSHLYLGHNKTYAASLWNDMTAKTGVLSNTPNDNLWFENYWSFLAFTNPSAAINLYNNYPTYKIKNGNSDAHVYHWLHAFNGMGTVDATVTSNYPVATVFNKAGDKTYVAHNYGSSEITVTYSDGFSMVVPARTLKTSKDIAVAATLSSSSTQVPTNGSVTLTAAVTGAGITKVEFYDGATLIDTKTAVPYTTTANNLAARIHGFYVKVYVGASLELSNVVSVVAGSQLPYQGNIVSIPSQVIEPGNYDYYEGGVGQNISYFDATIWNDAGTFRSPEYVDAGPTTGEGNTVGWIDEGEWLEYTVNIAQAGTYNLSIRYASGVATGGGPFHIEVDGNTVANNITVGFTGTNWNVWATKTVNGVILPAGQHIIRLVFDKPGFNIGRISFVYAGSANPSLGVSSNAVSIAAFANSKKTVDVTSNITWTAVSNQSWLAVAPTTAFGNTTVTFTAQENPTTSTRTASVTFSGNGVTDQVVTVTQDAGGVPYILVNPATMNFNAASNTAQNIEITSNVAWTASSNQSWLTLSSTSGNGVAVITANATDNPGTTSRSATITVTGSGLPAKTIAVTQNGAAIQITLPINFELSGTYVFTDFDGGVGSAVINPFQTGSNLSNKVGKIIRNSGATWAGSYLTLQNKIDFSTYSTFSMRVYSPRSGVPVLLKLEGDVAPSEILATTTTANNWETLTWNFAGKPSNVYNKLVFMFDFGSVGNGTANSTFYFDDIYQISSASNILNISKYAATIAAAPNSTQTFDIQSNVNWTITSSQSWLTPSVANGSGNAVITLTAEQNPTSSVRTANVLVSAPGLVPQTLIITQDLGTTAVSNIQNPLIKIYPNPAKDVIFIDGFSANAVVSLYDVTGKLLITQVLNQKQLDISFLKNGIYLLRITEKKGFTLKKLVKIN